MGPEGDPPQLEVSEPRPRRILFLARKKEPDDFFEQQSFPSKTTR